ncbi:MAG TPA: CATRA conflict system CASPASE/TPR repeat-associated protein [Trebonia sp.]|jgi:predicted nucleotide-binding protein|nr:CATRA conflict system CASPASE/TPR repeat-associated protein [Trebonia sp.]
MTEAAGVAQQLVVHLFAPAVGPPAEAAYTALREIWLDCRQFFLMRDPLPHGDLPHQLPGAARDLAGGAETVLAAQERRDADCQAILRRHHDVLNLSVALAEPPGTPPPAARSRWQDLAARWSFISERHAGALLGEARVYLAGSATPPGPHLDELLPASARIGRWPSGEAAMAGGLALREAPPWTDGRARRHFALAFAAGPGADAEASAWAWSDGGTAIPPLARYLLHAAKLRYLYRVWQRDDVTGEFTALVRSQAAGPPPAGPARDAPGGRELRQRVATARLMAADLRELRQGVEIAEHNMSQVISGAALLVPGGPFADDKNLARNFVARIDDELGYLDIAAERAAQAAGLLGEPDGADAAPPARTAPASGAAGRPGGRGAAANADITRNVFVVHGRDEQARAALFAFLEEVGLRPLAWETLVAATGSSAPYLRDVIMQGIAMAQAAVVLMTPEDVVRLHPGLHRPAEDAHEAGLSMQARPNVILELGMALATYADRTIVLYAGRHRPMADLNGLNYVELNGAAGCLDKVISRLKTAGCQVSDAAPTRRARARFRNLAAYQRSPAG